MRSSRRFIASTSSIVCGISRQFSALFVYLGTMNFPVCMYVDVGNAIWIVTNIQSSFVIVRENHDHARYFWHSSGAHRSPNQKSKPEVQTKSPSYQASEDPETLDALLMLMPVLVHKMTHPCHRHVDATQGGVWHTSIRTRAG